MYKVKMTEFTVDQNKKSLTDVEFGLNQCLENSQLQPEERKRLVEMRNEIYTMWNKYNDISKSGKFESEAE